MPHSTTKPTAVNYTAGVPIEQYSPEDPGSDSTLDASAEHERRALEAVLYALWAAFWLLMLLTAFGVLLASLDAGWEWLEQTRRAALGFAVSFTLFLLVAFDRQLVLSDTPADAFVANVFTGSWLLTMLGYGKRHLSFDSSLLRWARDASYPIYILHQTLMIAIAYFVIQEPWSPGAKYWVVLGGTSLACVALYEAIVRRFVVTRVMFGMKPDGAGLSRGFRRAGAERAAP